jgi:phosphatidate cytidylyltransferase
VVSVAAIVGDLAESMVKRDLGIKDMSHLLPGHGGLMDRLDSILFAVPAAYLLLSLIAPTS